MDFGQDDVQLKGWAVEARVYAEDPFRNFLPSIGRLSRYQQPEESRHVRVDTGIVEGSEVSMFYDPMIAKLIGAGDTREEALDSLADALDAYYIRGVNHNIGFLNALIAHPKVRAGDMSTNFIAQEYPDGFHPQDVPQADPMQPIAVAALVHYMRAERAASTNGVFQGISSEWVVIADKQHYAIYIARDEDGYAVTYEDTVYRVRSDWQPGDALVHATINGKHLCVQVDADGPGYRLYHRGRGGAGAGRNAPYRRADPTHDREDAAGHGQVSPLADARPARAPACQRRRRGESR